MGKDLNNLQLIYEDAVRAENEGRVDEAIQLLEIAGDSGLHLAYIRLGDLHKKLEKEDDAIHYYQLATNSDSEEIMQELRNRGFGNQILIKQEVRPIKYNTINSTFKLNSNKFKTMLSVLAITFMLQSVISVIFLIIAISKFDIQAILSWSFSLIIAIFSTSFYFLFSDLVDDLEKLKYKFRKK